MEKLMEIFEEFDIEKIGEWLPDPNTMFVGLDRWMVLLILAGPLVMLVLGIVYRFLAPKEANHSFGYRFFYAMAQVEVWQFAQKLAGVVFMGMGMVMTLIFGIISFRFGKLTPPDMVWLAVKCLLWQIVLAIIANLIINIIIIFNYDIKGNYRKDKPKPKFKGKKKKTAKKKTTAKKKKTTSKKKTA